MINKRISDLSCDKEEFYKVKSVNETALKDSGHFSSMSFNNSNTENGRRNRNRRIIWFNPAYNRNLKIIIGELFIKHVRKHLLKNSKYHKIFKLNTLKLSYCSTTSIENIIRQRKSKVLSKPNAFNNRKRNCRSKPNWPLNGKCLTQCLVYKALSATSNGSFGYYGTSEG